MTSFTIAISPEQASALESVLRPLEEAGSLPEALEYWPSMLANLPKDEAETPGILHGFCL